MCLKKLLFHWNTALLVLADPLTLHKCPFRSFCSAKLQRALVLLFHRNTAPFVLAEPLQLYTNAHSAAFAVQNCSEHSFYCFTGVPTPGCSQNPSSYTQMPLTQLLRSKTAASTCFTVSQVFQRQGARVPRTPQVAKSMLR